MPKWCQSLGSGKGEKVDSRLSEQRPEGLLSQHMSRSQNVKCFKEAGSGAWAELLCEVAGLFTSPLQTSDSLMAWGWQQIALGSEGDLSAQCRTRNTESLRVSVTVLPQARWHLTVLRCRATLLFLLSGTLSCLLTRQLLLFL